MTVVANFFSNVLKAIPVLIAKVGSVLLVIFTIGMLAGYGVATAGITPFIFLIPALAVVIMWYKLDEGVFLLILLTLLIVLFPETFNALISVLA